MTDFYVRLSYDEYKELENQLRNWESIETSHQTVEGFYHKALRIRVGTALFEFQGPLVKKPLEYTDTSNMGRAYGTERSFESICRNQVAQDSHCILNRGHEGPCKDNMGYTQADIYPGAHP